MKSPSCQFRTTSSVCLVFLSFAVILQFLEAKVEGTSHNPDWNNTDSLSYTTHNPFYLSSMASPFRGKENFYFGEVIPNTSVSAVSASLSDQAGLFADGPGTFFLFYPRFLRNTAPFNDSILSVSEQKKYYEDLKKPHLLYMTRYRLQVFVPHDEFRVVANFSLPFMVEAVNVQWQTSPTDAILDEDGSKIIFSGGSCLQRATVSDSYANIDTSNTLESKMYPDFKRAIEESLQPFLGDCKDGTNVQPGTGVSGARMMNITSMGRTPRTATDESDENDFYLADATGNCILRVSKKVSVSMSIYAPSVCDDTQITSNDGAATSGGTMFHPIVLTVLPKSVNHNDTVYFLQENSMLRKIVSPDGTSAAAVISTVYEHLFANSGANPSIGTITPVLLFLDPLSPHSIVFVTDKYFGVYDSSSNQVNITGGDVTSSEGVSYYLETVGSSFNSSLDVTFGTILAAVYNAYDGSYFFLDNSTELINRFCCVSLLSDYRGNNATVSVQGGFFDLPQDYFYYVAVMNFSQEEDPIIIVVRHKTSLILVESFRVAAAYKGNSHQIISTNFSHSMKPRGVALYDNHGVFVVLDTCVKSLSNYMSSSWNVLTGSCDGKGSIFGPTNDARFEGLRQIHLNVSMATYVLTDRDDFTIKIVDIQADDVRVLAGRPSLQGYKDDLAARAQFELIEGTILVPDYSLLSLESHAASIIPPNQRNTSIFKTNVPLHKVPYFRYCFVLERSEKQRTARIRKIDGLLNVVSTLFSSVRLSSSFFLLDPTSNGDTAFILDAELPLFLSISLVTGVVSTVAGQFKEEFSTLRSNFINVMQNPRIQSQMGVHGLALTYDYSFGKMGYSFEKPPGVFTMDNFQIQWDPYITRDAQVVTTSFSYSSATSTSTSVQNFTTMVSCQRLSSCPYLILGQSDGLLRFYQLNNIFGSFDVNLTNSFQTIDYISSVAIGGGGDVTGYISSDASLKLCFYFSAEQWSSYNTTIFRISLDSIIAKYFNDDAFTPIRTFVGKDLSSFYQKGQVRHLQVTRNGTLFYQRGVMCCIRSDNIPQVIYGSYGDCDVPGLVDGEFGTYKFTKNINALLLSKDEKILYVVDSGKLRRFNHDGEGATWVSTFGNALLNERAVGALVEASIGETDGAVLFFVANTTALVSFNTSSGVVSSISGLPGKIGHADGSIFNVSFTAITALQIVDTYQSSSNDIFSSIYLVDDQYLLRRVDGLLNRTASEKMTPSDGDEKNEIFLKAEFVEEFFDTGSAVPAVDSTVPLKVTIDDAARALHFELERIDNSRFLPVWDFHEETRMLAYITVDDDDPTRPPKNHLWLHSYYFSTPFKLYSHRRLTTALTFAPNGTMIVVSTPRLVFSLDFRNLSAPIFRLLQVGITSTEVSIVYDHWTDEFILLYSWQFKISTCFLKVDMDWNTPKIEEICRHFNNQVQGNSSSATLSHLLQLRVSPFHPQVYYLANRYPDSGVALLRYSRLNQWVNLLIRLGPSDHYFYFEAMPTFPQELSSAVDSKSESLLFIHDTLGAQLLHIETGVTKKIVNATTSETALSFRSVKYLNLTGELLAFENGGVVQRLCLQPHHCQLLLRNHALASTIENKSASIFANVKNNENFNHSLQDVRSTHFFWGQQMMFTFYKENAFISDVLPSSMFNVDKVIVTRPYQFNFFAESDSEWIVYATAAENVVLSLNLNNLTEISILAGQKEVRSGYQDGFPGLLHSPMGISFASGILAIADRDNHCIRTLTPSSPSITTSIGQCEVSGYKDGHKDEALLSYPVGVIRYRKQGPMKFYFTTLGLIRSCIGTEVRTVWVHGQVLNQMFRLPYASYNSISLLIADQSAKVILLFEDIHTVSLEKCVSSILVGNNSFRPELAAFQKPIALAYERSGAFHVADSLGANVPTFCCLPGGLRGYSKNVSWPFLESSVTQTMGNEDYNQIASAAIQLGWNPVQSNNLFYYSNSVTRKLELRYLQNFSLFSTVWENIEIEGLVFAPEDNSLYFSIRSVYSLWLYNTQYVVKNYIGSQVIQDFSDNPIRFYRPVKLWWDPLLRPNFPLLVVDNICLRLINTRQLQATTFAGTNCNTSFPSMQDGDALTKARFRHITSVITDARSGVAYVSEYMSIRKIENSYVSTLIFTARSTAIIIFDSQFLLVFEDSPFLLDVRTLEKINVNATTNWTTPTTPIAGFHLDAYTLGENTTYAASVRLPNNTLLISTTEGRIIKICCLSVNTEFDFLNKTAVVYNDPYSVMYASYGGGHPASSILRDSTERAIVLYSLAKGLANYARLPPTQGKPSTHKPKGTNFSTVGIPFDSVLPSLNVNLFISFPYLHCVKECATSQTCIDFASVCSGNRNADLNEPFSLLGFGASLIVADAGDHCLRKVNSQTGVWSVLSGTCGVPGVQDGADNATFTRPMFLAATPAVSIVYVAADPQLGFHTIRRIDMASKLVSSISLLHNAVPQVILFDAITVSAAGGASEEPLFIVDYNNPNHIQRLNTLQMTTSIVAGYPNITSTISSTERNSIQHSYFKNITALALSYNKNPGEIDVMDYTLRRVICCFVAPTTTDDNIVNKFLSNPMQLVWNASASLLIEASSSLPFDFSSMQNWFVLSLFRNSSASSVIGIYDGNSGAYEEHRLNLTFEPASLLVAWDEASAYLLSRRDNVSTCLHQYFFENRSVELLVSNCSQNSTLLPQFSGSFSNVSIHSFRKMKWFGENILLIDGEAGHIIVLLMKSQKVEHFFGNGTQEVIDGEILTHVANAKVISGLTILRPFPSAHSLKEMMEINAIYFSESSLVRKISKGFATTLNIRLTTEVSLLFLPMNAFFESDEHTLFLLPTSSVTIARAVNLTSGLNIAVATQPNIPTEDTFLEFGKVHDLFVKDTVALHPNGSIYYRLPSSVTFRMAKGLEPLQFPTYDSSAGFGLVGNHKNFSFINSWSYNTAHRRTFVTMSDEAQSSTTYLADLDIPPNAVDRVASIGGWDPPLSARYPTLIAPSFSTSSTNSIAIPKSGIRALSHNRLIFWENDETSSFLIQGFLLRSSNLSAVSPANTKVVLQQRCSEANEATAAELRTGIGMAVRLPPLIAIAMEEIRSQQNSGSFIGYITVKESNVILSINFATGYVDWFAGKWNVSGYVDGVRICVKNNECENIALLRHPSALAFHRKYEYSNGILYFVAESFHRAKVIRKAERNWISTLPVAVGYQMTVPKPGIKELQILLFVHPFNEELLFLFDLVNQPAIVNITSGDKLKGYSGISMSQIIDVTMNTNIGGFYFKQISQELSGWNLRQFCCLPDFNKTGGYVPISERLKVTISPATDLSVVQQVTVKNTSSIGIPSTVLSAVHSTSNATKIYLAFHGSNHLFTLSITLGTLQEDQGYSGNVNLPNDRILAMYIVGVNDTNNTNDYEAMYIAHDSHFIDEYNLKSLSSNVLCGEAGTHGYADGAGLDALLFTPMSIANFNGNNKRNFMFSDYSNHCIRGFDFETKKVTTVVGQCTKSGFRIGHVSQALLSFPTAIAARCTPLQSNFWPRECALYIFDSGNGVILKLNRIHVSIRTILPIPASLSLGGWNSLIYARHYGPEECIEPNWVFNDCDFMMYFIDRANNNIVALEVDITLIPIHSIGKSAISSLNSTTSNQTSFSPPKFVPGSSDEASFRNPTALLRIPNSANFYVFDGAAPDGNLLLVQEQVSMTRSVSPSVTPSVTPSLAPSSTASRSSSFYPSVTPTIIAKSPSVTNVDDIPQQDNSSTLSLPDAPLNRTASAEIPVSSEPPLTTLPSSAVEKCREIVLSLLSEKITTADFMRSPQLISVSMVATDSLGWPPLQFQDVSLKVTFQYPQGGSVISVNVTHNRTQLQIVLQGTADYYLMSDDHDIVLLVHNVSFDFCITPGFLPVSFEIEAISPEIPVTVQRSSEITTVATGSVAGMVGNPTLALQTGRATLVLELSVCEFSHTDPLDLTQNPIGLHFGSRHAQYYRGGVIGNFIVLFGAAFGFHLVAVFLRCGLATVNNHREALDRLRWPGMYVVPYVVLLQGTVTCSIAVMIHGADPLDIPIGLLGMIVMCAPMLIIVFLMTKRFQARYVDISSEFRIDTNEGTDMNVAQKVLKTRFAKFFMGNKKWKDASEDGLFKMRFGQIFADYREKMQAFLAIEILLSIFAGVLEGTRPNERKSCTWLIFLLVGLNLASAFAAFFIRPFLSPFNSIHAMITAGFTLLSAIFLLVAQWYSAAEMQGSGESLAVFVIYVAGIKAFVDIYVLIEKIQIKSIAEKLKATLQKGMNVSSALATPFLGRKKKKGGRKSKEEGSGGGDNFMMNDNDDDDEEDAELEPILVAPEEAVDENEQEDIITPQVVEPQQAKRKPATTRSKRKKHKEADEFEQLENLLLLGDGADDDWDLTPRERYEEKEDFDERSALIAISDNYGQSSENPPRRKKKFDFNDVMATLQGKEEEVVVTQEKTKGGGKKNLDDKKVEENHSEEENDDDDDDDDDDDEEKDNEEVIMLEELLENGERDVQEEDNMTTAIVVGDSSPSEIGNDPQQKDANLDELNAIIDMLEKPSS